jgi:hypothetical protein
VEIGLVTFVPEKVDGFNPHVYYSKWADGQTHPAAEGIQNDVTCFCDAKAIRDDPKIAAVSKDGPALRRNRRFNLPFDYVCPTNPEYLEKLLRYIEGVGKTLIEGVTLNLYHFPDAEFCVCPRCVELWRKSGLNWTNWRKQIITNFLNQAKSLVKGKFAVEMFPDPVLAKDRFGIDFEQITELVDYFHVPLSSRDYLTNYWVDLLARDFLKVLKKPVMVELSAEMLNEQKTEALLKTIAYLSRHDLQAVLLLVHNTENAREVCSYAVKNKEFHEWLAKYNFADMRQIVDNWAKIY